MSSDRQRRRVFLKSYYDGDATGEGASTADGEMAPPSRLDQDPTDINTANFDRDMYLTQVLSEKSLAQIMDIESDMTQQIRALDSDMRTLIYENYAKFIAATDTIKRMKNDFRQMEDEMNQLADNMSSITDFSGQISSTLEDRRQRINKLGSVHGLLQKLQFLMDLPTTLKAKMDEENYGQAVRVYQKARRVLEAYKDMPSFKGIFDETNAIVERLREKLKERFGDKTSTPQQLAECVELLLELNEPPESLCEDFLSHSRLKLDEDLSVLRSQLDLLHERTSIERQRRALRESSAPPQPLPLETLDRGSNSPSPELRSMDVLEFVDEGCNGFLSNMCLVIASYNEMFLWNAKMSEASENLDSVALKKLVGFVNSLMERYFSMVGERVRLEHETGENSILVRALDRFHRRLQAMNKLLPDTDFSRAGIEIVSKAAKERAGFYRHALGQHLVDCVMDVRQSLAAPSTMEPGSAGRDSPSSAEGGSGLFKLLAHVETSVVEQFKNVMANLRTFVKEDNTFALKSYFRNPFSAVVHEELVSGFLSDVLKTCAEYCDASAERSANFPPALLIILSRFCQSLSDSTISLLASIADENFASAAANSPETIAELSSKSREVSQNLLNHFVRVEGLKISQMLRKSVETRDWLNSIEPRNVRGVMKRVVEDVTAVDVQVGQLFEDSSLPERSVGSDSSRRTFPRGGRFAAAWGGSTAASSLGNSLISNIQKLFSEKIEIFSPVEFSRVSILTGIVKISLKTLLECVRLRTFSRYGLQQIQVDAHYLQLYLWRFVSDENVVYCLLDEIVASAANRCLDPVPMETSVVEVICERG